MATRDSADDDPGSQYFEVSPTTTTKDDDRVKDKDKATVRFAVKADTDTYENIGIKFGIFEDFVFPVTEAQTLLHSACKKRKEMLQKTMNLLLSIIQTNSTTPSQKDGALHDWNHG